MFSCKDPTSPAIGFTVTVSGQVFNIRGAYQDSIQLTLFNPFRNTDTTATDGTFNYSFLSEERNEVTTTLRFHHINNSFYDTSVSVTYSYDKKNVAIGEMKMRGVSSYYDSLFPGQPSTRAKKIKFISSSLKTISIRGAGDDVSKLTFEVRDSLDVPVDQNNSVSVFFKLIAKPDDLVQLNTTTTTTNTLGQAVVQLSSGEKAGQAQVQAFTTVKNVIDTAKIDTIKSDVVSVIIAGGLPVVSRFTLGADKVNVPGLGRFGVRNTIIAIVGDTAGNPVQKGTLVSFKTTGGIIQSSAPTTEDGIASVVLISGNPFPANGFVSVTAQVGTPGYINAKQNVNNSIVDESVIIKGIRNTNSVKKSEGLNSKKLFKSPSTFEKTIGILFSGEPKITSSDSVFIVPSLGSKQVQFTVDDINGNPMAGGTSIKVSGVGIDTMGIQLSGDVDVVLPDTYDNAFTKFKINVIDKRVKDFDKSIPFLLNIDVVGPNGNIKKTFNGVLTAASSDTSKLGSLLLVNSAVDSIVVNGAGFPVSNAVQVKALNTNNNPLTNVPILFTIVKTVGGGEYLSSFVVPTNASGIATVTYHSGIRPGLVQIQASVKENESTIFSDLKSIYVKTGSIAYLSLVSASSTSLTAKGGGGNENAVLIFEAKDSLGNIIDGSNQTNVNLVLQGDTLGSRINPTVMKTDPNTGRITSFLTAGVQSGIIQVIAKSGSILSPAVQIAVSGGLPVQSQFTLSLTKKNFSTLTDKSTLVSVIAGDANGNPAKPGTLINFKSNGGLIDASGITNNSGFASTNLQIVNPQPPLGIATIEAKTFGVNGNPIRDTQSVIFSRDAIISEIAGPYSNFEIEDGLSKTFQYSVADINGNPLAQGNLISVQTNGAGSSSIVLTGDINVSTSDTKLQGVGTTLFSFTARDTVKGEGQGSKPISFKISVVGPNTSGIVSRTLSGTLKSGGSADQNHFTMVAAKYNFPGLDLAFTTSNIIVQVGDESGKPVVDGTIVYFSSTHGTMTKDSLTSNSGFVTNTLYSANPFPQNKDTLLPDSQILSYYPSTKGFSRVYASTLGKNGLPVKDSLLFLWTGAPIVSKTGIDTFTISNGGSAGPFNFKIVDRFGHPMSAGTTVTVTASAGKVLGDVSQVIPDTYIGGSRVTTFSVTLTDNAPIDTDPPVNAEILITVNHPVYGITQFTLATGKID